MLMTEWKLEDALVVEWEEGMEAGLAKGREEGLEVGLAKGREEGLEAGREEGQVIGQAIGEAKAVNNLLSFGMTPEQISIALKLPLETVMQYRSNA
jgi:flagellar biosynthesis/type III secretory pathway protein FliH